MTAVPEGIGGSEELPRSERLTGDAEIRAIFRRGKRSRTVHLDVFDSPSPAAFSRVGVVVPKHRHNIVRRNVVKRRLREALRREVLPRLRAAALHIDVLVRARPEAYDAPYTALKEELVAWTDRRCSRAPASS